MQRTLHVNLARDGWVAFAILLLPSVVEACPMCASQQPGGAARIAALAAMLLLPFAIAGAVFAALRRADALAPPLREGRRWRARLWLGRSSLRRQAPRSPPGR
jgi:hypothetical protein